MKIATRILEYLAAALVVAVLGGLAGWYVFVQREIKKTNETDAARGFMQTPNFGTPASGFGSDSLPENTVTPGESGGTLAPRLWRVSQNPVAGMEFASSTDNLLFVERANGNVLRADPFTSQITRLTNTLMPRIYEALFSREGAVVLRGLSENGTATTFAGTVAAGPSTSTPRALLGAYLAQGIRDVAVHPSALTMAVLMDEPSGGASVITHDWKASGAKKLYTSSLAQWQLMWAGERLLITQSASDGIPGYAFEIRAGQITPVVENVPGLLVNAHPESQAILYSSAAQGAPLLYGRENANAQPKALPIRTLAEKCVWTPFKAPIAYCAVPRSVPAQHYLRDWYLGRVRTTDTWWKVDVLAGTAEELYTPDARFAIDVENPVMDDSGGYIAFMNAADKSLWMLRITE